MLALAEKLQNEERREGSASEDGAGERRGEKNERNPCGYFIIN